MKIIYIDNGYRKILNENLPYDLINIIDMYLEGVYYLIQTNKNNEIEIDMMNFIDNKSIGVVSLNKGLHREWNLKNFNIIYEHTSLYSWFMNIFDNHEYYNIYVRFMKFIEQYIRNHGGIKIRLSAKYRSYTLFMEYYFSIFTNDLTIVNNKPLKDYYYNINVSHKPYPIDFKKM